MGEEDLPHLRMELITTLRNRHLHMVMLDAEEAGLEDKEAEAEEEKFDVSNVTR